MEYKEKNGGIIVHFFALLSDGEKQRNNSADNIIALYNRAVARAKTEGGRAYKGKDFGGGIFFADMNLRDVEQAVARIMERYRQGGI